MLLIGVKKENGWLTSRWNTTYPMSWDHIRKGAAAVYAYYRGPEVLIGGKAAQVSGKGEICMLPEAANLTLRGMSTIIRCPLMVTFYNQVQAVEVTVPCMAGEFAEADYQRFNMSLGQYMDSIELAMYR